MSTVVWDASGERFYELGVDHGILFPTSSGNGEFTGGVAWNGLTTVTESPSGAEASSQYADNLKYLTLTSAEEFGATIEAFTWPPEFDELDGGVTIGDGAGTIGQQPRSRFGLAYRTKVGNDAEGQNFGYKLHLIYGAQAAPSEKAYGTVNDSPEAATFSWELSTDPIIIEGYSPVASITIPSKFRDGSTNPAYAAIEAQLITGTLPSPAAVIEELGGTTTTTTTA